MPRSAPNTSQAVTAEVVNLPTASVALNSVELNPVALNKGQDLKHAFEMFNEMSQQLADSYAMLENRVAELNQELTSVADKRLQELAEKEQLANRLANLLNFLPGGVVVLDSSEI